MSIRNNKVIIVPFFLFLQNVICKLVTDFFILIDKSLFTDGVPCIICMTCKDCDLSLLDKYLGSLIWDISIYIPLLIPQLVIFYFIMKKLFAQDSIKPSFIALKSIFKLFLVLSLFYLFRYVATNLWHIDNIFVLALGYFNPVKGPMLVFLLLGNIIFGLVVTSLISLKYNFFNHMIKN